MPLEITLIGLCVFAVPGYSQTVKTADRYAEARTVNRAGDSSYDWRKVEARLNVLPQFVTTSDGLYIHFIHVRSQRANALPVIITHGCPGSIIDQLKIIGPLTDPTAHGGKAEDAFDELIPSLSGYGLSGKPATNGWDPHSHRTGLDRAMKRPGYARFVAQGGNWGNAVTEQIALQLADSPAGLAAWMLDHDARSLSLIARVFDGQSEGLTRDDIRVSLRRVSIGKASFVFSPRRVSGSPLR